MTTSSQTLILSVDALFADDARQEQVILYDTDFSMCLSMRA